MRRLVHKLRRISEQIQDRRLGIQTFEFHTQIDPAHPESRGYSPTTYRDWRLMRPHIVADPHASFIDYGAGLGRVTILAASLPFRCVIGVEFSADLVDRANANVKRAHSSLRSPVKILCIDAAAVEVPNDASTLFFANPFAGSILASVLGRVRASYATQPRPIRLICSVPAESAFEQGIASVGWLKLTRHFVLTNPRRCMIFEPRD
jgi:SAM-dependent methyltransferase